MSAPKAVRWRKRLCKSGAWVCKFTQRNAYSHKEVCHVRFIGACREMAGLLPEEADGEGKGRKPTEDWESPGVLAEISVPHGPILVRLALILSNHLFY